MGCNANNHSPGSDCGWGGATRTGDLGSYVPVRHIIVTPPTPQQFIPADGKIWANSGVLDKPNAKCPVCGQPVYFVETLYGGRVFFDELGIPWPKHPCTDNPTTYISAVAAPQDVQQIDQSHNGWHILTSPIVTVSDGALVIKGHLKALSKYLHLRPIDAIPVNICPPILVRPSEYPGTYDVTFLTANPDITVVGNGVGHFVPDSAGLSDETWQAALQGDPGAENEIGWYFSFYWDSLDPKFEYAKNYEAARYWFFRSASHGNPSGMNNYGVLLARGLGGAADIQLAEEWLLKSASQMTAPAFGHLAKHWSDGDASDRSKLMAQLLLAVERHLQFEDVDDDSCEAAETNAKDANSAPLEADEYYYPPLPIEGYFHIETVRKISQKTALLPMWNLFWLSTSGLDESVSNPTAWHTSVQVPKGLIDTLLFDMEEPLSPQITLGDALKMHPRRFLHFFATADLSKLDVFKRNGDEWRAVVVVQAEEAANRIGASTSNRPAVILRPAFGSNHAK